MKQIKPGSLVLTWGSNFVDVTVFNGEENYVETILHEEVADVENSMGLGHCLRDAGYKLVQEDE